MAMNRDLSAPCARTTPAAGEAFIKSFTDMTRSMLAQSKALARTVSLAQVLETDSNRDCNTNNGDDDDKENVSNAAAASAATSNRAGSAYREKVLNDLRSLATIVADLERRAAEVRATVNREREGVAEMKEMRVTARQRADDLAAACRNLPQHLPHAAPASPSPSPSPPSTMVATTTVTKIATNANDSLSSRANGGRGTARGGHGDEKIISSYLGDSGGEGEGEAYRAAPASLATVPTVELVTVSELESVARSTRGRLTITMVNDAVTEIQKAVEKRRAFLAKPRAKLSEKLLRRLDEIHRQEVPEHAGKPFLAEADLRALPAFRKGEVTAKALIATLRSLKRLKGVRAAGVMTYIVEGTYF